MDLLNGNIKRIYFKYLSAAFGSALISSLYSLVDMAMVGQYQGPNGTAALAVVVSRGLVVSGLLIYILPMALNPDSIWFAMPITEALTAVFVIKWIHSSTRNRLS